MKTTEYSHSQDIAPTYLKMAGDVSGDVRTVRLENCIFVFTTTIIRLRETVTCDRVGFYVAVGVPHRHRLRRVKLER